MIECLNVGQTEIKDIIVLIWNGIKSNSISNNAVYCKLYFILPFSVHLYEDVLSRLQIHCSLQESLVNMVGHVEQELTLPLLPHHLPIICKIVLTCWY